MFKSFTIKLGIGIGVCILIVLAFFMLKQKKFVVKKTVEEFLESDQEITTIDIWSGKYPNEIRNEKKGIFSCDINNDGKNEKIVFYTTKLLPDGTSPQDTIAGILVLKETHRGYIKLWEDKGHEAENSFDEISSVRDINKDSKVDIVAMRWVGASAGASLDIYTWDGKTFKEISGSWMNVHHVEFKDVNNDKIDEIIVDYRFDPSEIYKWNGEKYVLYKK